MKSAILITRENKKGIGMNINEECLLSYLLNPEEINSIRDAILDKEKIDATALLPQNIFISFANYSN